MVRRIIKTWLHLVVSVKTLIGKVCLPGNWDLDDAVDARAPQILAAERPAPLSAPPAAGTAGAAALGGATASGDGAPAEAGAHVVMPCPHDGSCPMDGTGSWCHFAQRFRRTTVQKRIKTLFGAPPWPRHS